MTWHNLKQKFEKEISTIYENREAEQMFFLLLEAYWGISKMDFILKKQERVCLQIVEKVNNTIQLIQTNQPIQHILGYGYFFERKFFVSKDVLIPRQETELLIDIILKEKKSETSRVLDIGTGTGCIPITLKLENRLFRVSSIDVSKKARSIAKRNAKQLDAKVNFELLDILNEEEWHAIPDQSFDIIVSNPPYVLESEKALMQKNVLDFEPELALFVSNENPLIFYKSIINFANQKLVKGGCLYFEINETYGKEVCELLNSNQFIDVNLYQDFQEKDRFVRGVKL